MGTVPKHACGHASEACAAAHLHCRHARRVKRQSLVEAGRTFKHRLRSQADGWARWAIAHQRMESGCAFACPSMRAGMLQTHMLLRTRIIVTLDVSNVRAWLKRAMGAVCSRMSWARCAAAHPHVRHAPCVPCTHVVVKRPAQHVARRIPRISTKKVRHVVDLRHIPCADVAIGLRSRHWISAPGVTPYEQRGPVGPGRRRRKRG